MSPLRPCHAWITLWAVLACLTLANAARADEPFDYFRNSFSVIGLKDYLRRTRVTPDNQLQLADKATVRLRFGRQLTPLSRGQTKTLVEGWMPVVLLTAEDGPVCYEFTLWATPLPSVKDWRKAFDWPTEGENFLNRAEGDQHGREAGRSQGEDRADRRVCRGGECL